MGKYICMYFGCLYARHTADLIQWTNISPLAPRASWYILAKSNGVHVSRVRAYLERRGVAKSNLPPAKMEKSLAGARSTSQQRRESSRYRTHRLRRAKKILRNVGAAHYQ